MVNKMLNIILTIILLLAVGVIVWRGWPLIWATFIILSIVLYYSVFGRLTQLQTPWLIGAGVLWAVGLVLVIKNGSKKTGTTVLFLVIMTVALVAMSFWAPKVDSSSVAVDTGQKVETAAASTNTEPVTLANFNPDFVQVASDNTGNKVDATWESGLAQNLLNSGNNYDEAFRLLVLQRTSTNAHLFAIWANAAGLYGDPNNWQSLVEGGKLSPDAQKLWWQFSGLVKTAKAKPVQANSNGVNTGMSNGIYGSASSSGISGDMAASQLDLSNGDSVVALNRCGNLVLPSKPSSLPSVPTDNPPGGKGGPPITPPDTPDTPLTPKDPAESTLANPAVDDWKKDETSSNTVSDGNGAEVSNGYQADPVQDAADAAADAADAAAENAATHEDAVNEATDTGGGVVDNNQDHTVTTDPAVTNPDW